MTIIKSILNPIVLKFNYLSKAIEEKNSIIDKVKNRIKLDDSDYKNISNLITLIKQKNGIISKEGYVTCYYALSKYNKKKYNKSGIVSAGSDKIIVSTKNGPNLKKFGDKILTLHIPIERLFFVYSSKDEVLLKIPFVSPNRELNIKQFVKDF